MLILHTHKLSRNPFSSFRSKANILKMSSPSSSNTPTIGFIGVGIMGEGMAARLLSEGIAGTTQERPLIIWNRTAKKCEDLKEKFPDKFVVIKDHAKDVVDACDITFSILSTPEASKSVFYDPNGVLAGVREGKSIVDCATLAESDMKQMNEDVKSKGG